MLRHARLVAALAALLLAVSATPAAAGGAPVTQIRLGRSIGPIHLGMTRATVQTIDAGEVELAPVTGEFPAARFRYPGARQTVWYPTDALDATAIFAVTAAPIYRTAAGIHVGSTRAALRAAHPATRCPTRGMCVIGQELPGRRVTVFRLRAGVIGSIAVGFVRD